MSDKKKKGQSVQNLQQSSSQKKITENVTGIVTIEQYGKPLASPSCTFPHNPNLRPSAFPALTTPLSTQNKFSVLTKPFNQAVSSPSQKEVPSPTHLVQNSSSNSAKYFQKQIFIPIDIVESGLVLQILLPDR